MNAQMTTSTFDIDAYNKHMHTLRFITRDMSDPLPDRSVNWHPPMSDAPEYLHR